jgi:hypothetical protein
LDGNDSIEDFQRSVDRLVLDALDSDATSGDPVTVSDPNSNVIVGFDNGGGEITLFGAGNGTINSLTAAINFGIDIVIA